ncbi:MAG: nucleotide exchange factor GrpE [Melioribacteraceae bacterium]|nr:nucleotide exchange factor GrpE [Melioribacteraceae bacterium]
MDENKDENLGMENEETKHSESNYENANQEENLESDNNEMENETGNDLQKKIEELEKANFDLKDTLLRRVADFENYKRRVNEEQKSFLSFANESLLLNILPVYDDLERSLEHADEQANYESIKKGLQLVFDKFTKVLEGQGIAKIAEKGDPFDFNLHDALMQKPDDSVPPHTVLEVLEKGYKLRDKVIRHAKVIVSQELIS